MSNDPRKLALAHLTAWKTRSLIVEFKGAVSTVSGLFKISEISESSLRLRFAETTCVNCELDIWLSALHSFTLTTFAEATNTVLKPAVEAFIGESGHRFHTDIVEKVAVIGLADSSTLLIGVLKEDKDMAAMSPQMKN